MKVLKVFKCNYDGRVTRGICTDTKKRALEMLDIPSHHFRNYGTVLDWEHESSAALHAVPHVPMEQRISAPDKQWFPLGTFRDYALHEHEAKREEVDPMPFVEWWAARSQRLAYEAGNAAYYAERGRETNPHTEELLRDSWFAGWDAAYENAEDAED